MRPLSRVMVLVNLSYGAAPESAGAGEPAALVVPSYSGWFKFGQIHEVEKRALPEFFSDSSGGKSPGLYVEYRDFMINTYRIRPKDYLSVTTCRRHLTGDVGAIVRVHLFLEQWGLINFQVEPALKPGGSGKATPSAGIPKAVVSQTKAALAGWSAASRQPMVRCAVCGSDCVHLYFHAARNNAPFTVCPTCYGEGKYPLELSSVDFSRIDVDKDKVLWSEEETLALLTAVEEHQQAAEQQIDWDAVAAKVGRSREQCVCRFLRLPILDSADNAEMFESLKRVSDSAPMAGFPLSNVENPIMSTVAVLASLVHPRVAAAAAQAAMSEVARMKRPADKMEVDGGETADLLGGGGIQQIAGAALGVAAARAGQLSVDEGLRVARLRDMLVELQLQKLRLKLSFFEELEKSLEEERKDIEQQRLQLFMDRFNLRKMMLSVAQKHKDPDENVGGRPVPDGVPAQDGLVIASL